MRSSKPLFFDPLWLIRGFFTDQKRTAAPQRHHATRSEQVKRVYERN